LKAVDIEGKMRISIEDVKIAALKGTDIQADYKPIWVVSPEYQIVPSEEVDAKLNAWENGAAEQIRGKTQTYVVTPSVLPRTIEIYQPLKYHDLFLDFARHVDRGPVTPESVFEWCQQYGPLGAPKIGDYPFVERASDIHSYNFWRQDVDVFEQHAKTANRVLRLYEAYTDPRGLDVETLKGCGVTGKTPKQLLANAQGDVFRTVNQILAGEIFGRWYPRRGGGYVRSQGFRSLLGAMCIQFDLLLAASEDVKSLCKLWEYGECNKIIAFEQPEDLADVEPFRKNDRSKGYATRRDKTFCSAQHKNRYYYLTVTKPRRQTARSQRGNGRQG